MDFDVVELPVVCTNVALRPCPFCAGIAEVCTVTVGHNVDGFGMDIYAVACTSCCSVSKPFAVPSDAAEFWNKPS